MGQLAAQAVAVVAVTAWSLGTGFLMFWALNKTMGLRAPREEELSGLDLPEHGTPCYPEELASAFPSPVAQG